jgi:hypothetical protein
LQRQAKDNRDNVVVGFLVERAYTDKGVRHSSGMADAFVFPEVR